MKVFLTGVSCVGKMTIGAKLASLLGYPFFDLDHGVGTFANEPVNPGRFQRFDTEALRPKLDGQRVIGCVGGDCHEMALSLSVTDMFRIAWNTAARWRGAWRERDNGRASEKRYIASTSL